MKVKLFDDIFEYLSVFYFLLSYFFIVSLLLFIYIRWLTMRK